MNGVNREELQQQRMHACAVLEYECMHGRSVQRGLYLGRLAIGIVVNAPDRLQSACGLKRRVVFADRSGSAMLRQGQETAFPVGPNSGHPVERHILGVLPMKITIADRKRMAIHDSAPA